MLLSVLLLLLMVSGTQPKHYYGTVVTYYPKETYTNGSVSLFINFKFNFHSCQEGLFSCTGNCANKSLMVSNSIIEKIDGSWCQREKITLRLFSKNSPFQLVYDSRNWLINHNGIKSWRAVVDVELRHRSDTNKPNSSPQTTILPALRVPSNCQRNINLLAFDPDGDEVKCRYASTSLEECHSPCTPPPVLSLSSNCTLSFGPTLSRNEGSYAVQMVIEDFPRQPITLTQTDGPHVSKATRDVISKIPIQFAFLVDPAAPSCLEGGYLPRFVSPTPEHGTRFYRKVNDTLEINIRALAKQSVISELLYSGPSNVVKNSLGSGNFSLTWTPSAREDGQSHPICFVVQGSSVYQSELRCVLVTVGNKPKPTFVNVLKMKISTSLSLKVNADMIGQMIKEELIRRGFPPGITVRLLSNGSIVDQG